MLAYRHEGKRKFDSYSDEAEAIQEAEKKARQMSTLGIKAAQLGDDDLRIAVTAMDAVRPLGISLTDAVSRYVEAFNISGDVIAAAKFYKARHKSVTAKRVEDVVAELVKVKESRGASVRYLADLRGRLTKFANVFRKDIGNVTTSEIQEWLDGLKSSKGAKLANGSYAHIRQKLQLLFNFAVARGYAHDNPIESVEQVKIKRRATLIFTPLEITRLLDAAKEKFPDFLPSLAIGAFAGLRSAEIERLEWSDIDLAGGHITVAADKAKTASRRIVPVMPNLSQWLAPYAGRAGKVWTGSWLYRTQHDCAAATEVKADEAQGIKAQAPVKWKPNGLRHSFASYRLAQTQNAAQVALECGNSPQMIFRHYRELVKPGDAVKWFSVNPKRPANVIAMAMANERAMR